VYGKDGITRETIEEWTGVFDSGPTDLTDLPRSGKQHDIGKVDDVHALVESEGYMSQKKIAQMLGRHHETVKSILRNDLNMGKVNFK
jgi:hypothetical protein